MRVTWANHDVRAVFFDAVGTLIQPHPPATEVYLAVGRRFGSQRTLADIGRRFSHAFREEEARDQANGWRTSEARELDRWRRIVATVLDDATDAAACFTALYEHFAQFAGWRCDPDAAGTLDELARRGFQLGLASNFDSRLRRVVAGLPALALLTHLVISSEVGWRKPAAAFYATLCQQANRPPEHILLVGDDLRNDYDGARSAGLAAVLLDPHGSQGTAISQIERLSDLLRHLPVAPGSKQE